MMNYGWALLAIVGIGFATATMSGAEVSSALLHAAMDAVSLAIRLAGGFAFWNGLMAILEDSGLASGMSRALSKPLARLFPRVAMQGEAGQAMTMNLVANFLGLGNAATPMGLKAMRTLGQEAHSGIATDTMCMFLVLNSASIQLLPTSVIALRAAAGSQAPASILLPTWVATLVSTAVGIAACTLLARRRVHG